MTSSRPPAAPPDGTPASATALGRFAAASGLTSLAILVQAVLAGAFVSQNGRAGWITAHSYVAIAVMVFALITAVLAWGGLRAQAPHLWQAATVLFVLTVIQTGIGHAITDSGADGLIVVHVPLALIIFGITVWLSAQAAQLRRGREGAHRV
ncbi:MAG TPA: hypothetical protein VGN54_08985 [Mycobacteriales bacterium]|jgi:hypothetical protein|nr:hypothetical protein [Mycobacteriales bacterium]